MTCMTHFDNYNSQFIHQKIRNNNNNNNEQNGNNNRPANGQNGGRNGGNGAGAKLTSTPAKAAVTRIQTTTNPTSRSQLPTTIKCYNCGVLGHISPNCTKPCSRCSDPDCVKNGQCVRASGKRAQTGAPHSTSLARLWQQYDYPTCLPTSLHTTALWMLPRGLPARPRAQVNSTLPYKGWTGNRSA
jgi:hypothetical protein